MLEYNQSRKELMETKDKLNETKNNLDKGRDDINKKTKYIEKIEKIQEKRNYQNAKVIELESELNKKNKDIDELNKNFKDLEKMNIKKIIEQKNKYEKEIKKIKEELSANISTASNVVDKKNMLTCLI